MLLESNYYVYEGKGDKAALKDIKIFARHVAFLKEILLFWPSCLLLCVLLYYPFVI